MPRASRRFGEEVAPYELRGYGEPLLESGEHSGNPGGGTGNEYPIDRLIRRTLDVKAKRVHYLCHEIVDAVLCHGYRLGGFGTTCGAGFTRQIFRDDLFLGRFNSHSPARKRQLILLGLSHGATEFKGHDAHETRHPLHRTTT